MKLKIDKNIIRWCPLIFLLFPPEYINQNTIVSWAFAGIAGMIGILALITDIREGIKIDKYIVTIFLMQLWILIMTLLNFEGMLSGIKMFVRIVVICYILSKFIKFNPTIIYLTLVIVFHFYILINTITLFVFPNAMYLDASGAAVCWFLGGDNYGFSFYLLANVLALIYGCQKKKIFLPFFSLLCSFIFAWRNDIATAKMCIILLLLLFMAGIIKKIRQWLNMNMILIINGIIFCFLIFIRSFQRIENLFYLLGRNLSFTGRTLIWDMVVDNISKKPILGHGVYSADMFSRMLNLESIFSAHNYYLMILFHGGIIALILFLIAMIFAGKKNQENDIIDYLLLIGIAVFMIREQVEYGGYELLYILVTIYCYRDNLKQSELFQAEGDIINERKIIE